MRRGQTLAEYLLLGILIAIVALTVFGGGLRNRYANTVNRLPFP
jgi:hypothetical protein